MKNYNIKFSKLNKFVVNDLLIKSSDSFSPSLCDAVDINQFSDKLSKYANFAYIEIHKTIKACIAYYLNWDNRYMYIPYVWVSNDLSNQGIATQLLNSLHYQAQIHGYRYSELEVRKDNAKAYNLYLKLNYMEQEDRDIKILLRKTLN